jgi:hypothetical protein
VGQDGKRGVDPQVRIEWSAGVMAGQVEPKGIDRVKGSVGDARENDDTLPSKKLSALCAGRR